MAEAVVSSLIDRLISLLTQKAELLSGIDGEVAKFRLLMKMINLVAHRDIYTT